VQRQKHSRIRKILDGPFGILIFGWGIGLVAIAAAILFIWLSMLGFGEWSFDEVARVTNLKAEVDAVLVETNGGATTSFGYQVFLLPRGQKPKRGAESVASLYGAWRSERASGVNMRWDKDDALAVEYLDAQYAFLHNASLNVNGHDLAIGMKSGVTDSAAPGGGMLYNLERGR
jgi:hypothetical protein